MIERLAMTAMVLALAGCGGSPAPVAENEAVAPNVAVATNEVSPPAAEAAPGPSREPIGYTSLKAGDCTLIEENREEAGYARHRCKGLGGYTLETNESDLRQDITVISGGARTELGLSGKVANGAFNSLGPAAEWRGADSKTPTSLIVRLGVANGAEPNRPDTSNLVVVRLKPAPCVVKIVPPGAGQNDRARDAADGPTLTCL